MTYTANIRLTHIHVYISQALIMLNPGPCHYSGNLISNCGYVLPSCITKFSTQLIEISSLLD